MAEASPYLLPGDGVDLNHVVVEAKVVEDGARLAAEGTGLVLEQRELDPRVVGGVDDAPGHLELGHRLLQEKVFQALLEVPDLTLTLLGHGGKEVGLGHRIRSTCHGERRSHSIQGEKE